MPISIVAIHIVELIAALAGTYYYFKTMDNQIKIFIWYLWVVVFVETLGTYSFLLLNNYDFDWYLWLKNSVLCTNTWLYNIFNLVSIVIFGKFYLGIIKSKSSKIIIKGTVLLYAIFTILYFLISGTFFEKSIPYDYLLATFVVLIYVILYYIELLSSNKVLFFYKLPNFYISSGLLIFFLTTAPLFTFDSYFYSVNKSFVEFRYTYMLIVNTFLYSCFTFAFLYTIQFKKE